MLQQFESSRDKGFFDELLTCHLRDQRIARKRLARALPDDESIYALLENLAVNQWKNEELGLDMP